MRKVYLALSKQETRTTLISRCVAHLHSVFTEAVERSDDYENSPAVVTTSDDIDWEDELNKTNKSHAAAYVNVVSKFDDIVILERYEHLGRGLYEQAKLALEMEKPVWVVRAHDEDDTLTLFPVEKLVSVNPDDWTWRYGAVVIKT